MKLKKYMKDFKVRQRHLGAVLGITQGAISHKLSNRRPWKLKEAVLIERHTKGMVSRMEILYPNG